MSSKRINKTIWIDLDNSPHVPFFVPIINELEKKGHTVILTARDTFQGIGLADYYKLNYTKVGRHYGANKLLKIFGTVWRSVQLCSIVFRHKPHISMSHGSRSLVLLSAALGIPTILMFDYEHATMLPIIKPELGIAPDVIRDGTIAGRFKRGLRAYSGIKEDVYVSSFRPGPSILKQYSLKDDDILVVIRPPASEAHYHNAESDKLFRKVIDVLGSKSGVRMIILPRNEKSQKNLIFKTWPIWCEEKKIIVPDQVVDGLNLIWHSDLVISGGGTMNREAAALGVPVYSIFRGVHGAVDKYLAKHGRLVMIENCDDVVTKIQLIKRRREALLNANGSLPLTQITAAIEEVLTQSSTS